jgi:hypothetical protein
MESVEVVYYTCLNNDCPKHRNIFLEGDPEHANCARERLWLEGQRPAPPRWLWFAIPAGLAVLAAAAVLVSRKIRDAQFKPPMLLGQDDMKTWSGAQAHRDDREGNPVPPPMRTGS